MYKTYNFEPKNQSPQLINKRSCSFSAGSKSHSLPLEKILPFLIITTSFLWLWY